MKVSMITGASRWPETERGPIHEVLVGTELLIVGDAPGVDRIAIDWAIANDCIVRVYCCNHLQFAQLQPLPNVYVEMAADWRKWKKQAGNIRNARMVREAAEVQIQLGLKVSAWAFPLAGSTGTWDCYQQAKDAGIDIQLYE